MSDDKGAQLEHNLHGLGDEEPDLPSIYDKFNPTDEHGKPLPLEVRYSREWMLAQPETEVTERVFWHFLEILPPYFWRSDGRHYESFVMCEAQTHTPDGNVISSAFARRGKRYFHSWIEIDGLAWHKEEGATW